MSLLVLKKAECSQRIDLQHAESSFLNWLQNAVNISLFTDARCEKDELPQGETNQRGYWGDFELPERESLGSKLWTLKREKVTPRTINRTRDYAAEALEWLVDEGYLQQVNVEASRGGTFVINLLIKCQLNEVEALEIHREYQIGEAA